jgi:chaperone required for assembly of F1-ATPase
MASLATDLDDYTREMHRETIQLVFEDDILGPRNEKPPAHLEQLWKSFHDPCISWFRHEYDVGFTVDNTMNTKQPRKSSRVMMRGVNALDDWALIGLVTNVDTTLSLVLSLALWNGHCSVEDAAAASRAEYVIQEASWGDVPGNTDIRRLNYLMDLHSSTFFLHALPTPAFSGEWLRSLPAKAPRRYDELQSHIGF